MYSILDRYIGRVILYNICIVLFILISLSSIIKFIDELRKVGQGNYGILEVGMCVFLGIAKDIEIFLPMAILLGVVLGMGLFLVRNELIVLEVFGFSRLRTVYSLVKIAFPVILFGIFINEWVVPISERLMRDYRYKMMNNVSVRTFNDLWIKDGHDFIYVEKMIRCDELLGMHIYHFSKDNNLKSVRYVTHAKFVKNIWNLVNIHELYFYDRTCVFEKQYFGDVWLTSVTPHYLLMTVMSLYYFTSLSVFDLYHCIFLFKHHGQDVVQYQLRFWKKLCFPISVIIMMLTALSQIFKFLLYKLNFGYQVAIGIIYSFFFMF